MTILPPSNHGLRARGPTGFQAANAEAERRRAEQAAREADPVEQAVRYLRTRGRTIFRASVHGGPHDKWKMAGRLLSGPDVIAQADALRALTQKLRPPAQPVDRAANAEASPIKFGQLVSPAPRSTPAASATAQPQEHPMGHHFKAETAEQTHCRERGTTTAAVKAHLAALRDKLGTGGAADRLGVGKSSVGNIIGGHAVVGPTILTALYGESGCTLKPSLAALLNEAAPAEKQPAAQVVTTPSADEATPVADDQAEAEQLGAACKGSDLQANPSSAVMIAAAEAAAEPQTTEMPTIGSSSGSVVKSEGLFDARSLLPNLATITAADLLANAERRRAQLRAELAQVDEQIRAVLQLSQVAG